MYALAQQQLHFVALLESVKREYQKHDKRAETKERRIRHLGFTLGALREPHGQYDQTPAQPRDEQSPKNIRKTKQEPQQRREFDVPPPQLSGAYECRQSKRHKRKNSTRQTHPCRLGVNENQPQREYAQWEQQQIGNALRSPIHIRNHNEHKN